MKKRIKTVLICIAAVPLIWGWIFATDYFLVTKAHSCPLFCIPFPENHVGLGYSYVMPIYPTVVELDGIYFEYTFYLFGKERKHEKIHITPEELGY